MILNDGDIAKRMDHLFPPDLGDNASINKDTQIQPASIDLRLGHTFWYYRSEADHRVLDPLMEDVKERMVKVVLGPCDKYVIHPGHRYFCLGHTMEYIVMPSYLVGRVDGRSSLGRLGVRVHSTAGFIDPGFRGQITLEIDVVGSSSISLTPGMRVCQISFETLTASALRPYGVGRNSKYIDQLGAQPSMAHRDGPGRK